RIIMADWFAAIEANIAFDAGHVAEAVTLAKAAVGLAKSVGGIFAEGLAHRTWAQALATLNPPQWDDAEAHLAESLRLLEEGDARLEAARTHVACGEICCARGNDTAAREHFEKAAAQFEASGLTEELERTRELMT